MSSSSSSSQTSGSMGKMVEMSDNGCTSGCWNSVAAIGKLRGAGGINADGAGGGHVNRAVT